MSLDTKISLVKNRHDLPEIKRYQTWLEERNIKYLFGRYGAISGIAYEVQMGEEDAAAFKLTFGL